MIVVLGHSSCGAVKGACDNVKLGKLTGMLDKIKPAIKEVEMNYDDRTSKNTGFCAASETKFWVPVLPVIEIVCETRFPTPRCRRMSEFYHHTWLSMRPLVWRACVSRCGAV